MSILEAILPELQKIVSTQNQTSGSNIICTTIGKGDYRKIRIQNTTDKPILDSIAEDINDMLKQPWLDIGQNQITYYYSDTNLQGIQLKQEDWTDPQLLEKLTQHIKTIASNHERTTNPKQQHP